MGRVKVRFWPAKADLWPVGEARRAIGEPRPVPTSLAEHDGEHPPRPAPVRKPQGTPSTSIGSRRGRGEHPNSARAWQRPGHNPARLWSRVLKSRDSGPACQPPAPTTTYHMLDHLRAQLVVLRAVPGHPGRALLHVSLVPANTSGHASHSAAEGTRISRAEVKPE